MFHDIWWSHSTATPSSLLTDMSFAQVDLHSTPTSGVSPSGLDHQPPHIRRTVRSRGQPSYPQARRLVETEMSARHHDVGRLGDVVVGDLRRLVELFGQDATDRSALEASAIIRRLAIDGLLAQYRKACGLRIQPQLKYLDLDRWICRHSAIRLAACGDITLGQLTYGPFITGLPGGDISTLGWWPSSTGRLRDFMSATCIIAMGRSISRHSLVKYIANKLGGVHFDPSRKSDDHDFRSLDAATSPPRGQLLAGPGELQPVLAEMLGLAQHILRSPEILAMLPTELAATVPASKLTYDVRNSIVANHPIGEITFDINFDTGEISNIR